MRVVLTTKDDKINWNAKGNERIIQNIRNILKTKKYCIPFLRNMGIDYDLLDKDVNENTLLAEVKDNIEKYQPNVEVLRLSIVGVNSNGDINIEVEIDIKEV